MFGVEFTASLLYEIVPVALPAMGSGTAMGTSVAILQSNSVVGFVDMLLEECMKQGLVLLVEDSDTATHRFKNSVLKDVLYDSVAFSLRRRLHKMIAIHLDRNIISHDVAAIDKASTLEMVADHFQLAGADMYGNMTHLIG